jgi:eukaryotic-like serine/threonine-protein kinase
MARQQQDERTALIWKISTSSAGESVSHSPRQRVVPPTRTSAAAAPSKGALDALARLRATSAATAGERFAITATIGVGGMGIVRQANQVALGRTVAVKTLRPDKRTDPATLDLLREAWIAGSLDHPNVVPVHDICVDESGNPIVVLKRIEGVVWSELIRDAAQVRERFGADDLLVWNLGILMQVLNAVRFAHSRGVVHRDIKPDNVMIGEFGEVYVVDWGLAVSLRDDGTGRLPLAANATQMAGTPCYMAPEMLGDSDVPISELTDIYLIGATLYEILTGHPPHTGSDAVAIITSMLTAELTFPPHVPDGLARICRRAMDPDPTGRFENVEQVRLALQGFLQHRGSALLCDKARATLADLCATLERPGASDAEHRQELYRLFGACRFGFLEALSAWHRNDSARAGLEQATLAMVEYELQQGDARAAAALSADLPEPPPALRMRIDEALRAAAEEKRRVEKLARLGRQLDMSVGRRARTLAAVVLGLTFTLVPLIVIWTYGVESFATHPRLMIWNSAYLGVAAVVGFLAREALRASVVNRRLYTMLMLLLVANVPLELGLWGAGIAASESLLVHVFVCFFVAATVSVTIEKRLFPSAIGYLIGFVTLSLAPEYVFYVITAPHALLTLNAVIIWWPRPPSQASEAGREPAHASAPRARPRADTNMEETVQFNKL